MYNAYAHAYSTLRLAAARPSFDRGIDIDVDIDTDIDTDVDTHVDLYDGYVHEYIHARGTSRFAAARRGRILRVHGVDNRAGSVAPKGGAVCCSVLQCVAVICSVLQCVARYVAPLPRAHCLTDG